MMTVDCGGEGERYFISPAFSPRISILSGLQYLGGHPEEGVVNFVFQFEIKIVSLIYFIIEFSQRFQAHSDLVNVAGP